MEKTNSKMTIKMETMSRYLSTLEVIFEQVKSFSERSNLHIEKFQKLIVSLLDFDNEIDNDFEMPIISLRKFDSNIKITANCSNFKKSESNFLTQNAPTVDSDAQNSLDFLEIFKDHNKKMMELVVNGKTNVGSVRDTIGNLFESFVTNTEVKTLQSQNEKLKIKVKNLKNLLQNSTEENFNLKSFKRITEETQKFNEQTIEKSQKSLFSEQKSNNPQCEKHRIAIDQKSQLIQSLFESNNSLKAQLIESSKSIKKLESQIRLLEDDFINLYKTINSRFISTSDQTTDNYLINPQMMNRLKINSSLSNDFQNYQLKTYTNEPFVNKNDSKDFEKNTKLGDQIIEKESLGKNERLSRVYSFSNQIGSDKEQFEMKDDHKSKNKHISLGKLKKVASEEKINFLSTPKQNVENGQISPNKDIGIENMQNDIKINQKYDSIFKFGKEDEDALVETEKVFKNNANRLIEKQQFEENQQEKKSDQYENSFVEYSSDANSEKQLNYDDNEKIVLVKETGLNRIDAADFAMILFSQNMVIEKEGVIDMMTGANEMTSSVQNFTTFNQTEVG